MEQAIHAAAGIGLQFLFLCAALLAAIGFRFLFMTRQLIAWPWVKPVERLLSDGEPEVASRRGRSAGVYFYALAIQQCGIGNPKAVESRTAQLISAAEAQLPQDIAKHFKAGAAQGIALLNDVLVQQQVYTITRHMPEIQIHVAQISSKVMRATTLCTGEAETLLISAKSHINKLQGITQ